MYTGKLVFAQVMEHIPMKVFRRCVQDLQREPQDQILQLPGSIPLHGLCSTDLSGESQGNRDLPPSANQQALPHGNTWRHCSQHAVQRQQSTALENLRRLCRGTDKNRQAIVCRREFGTRAQQYNLRARFFHHRSVSVSFPMGSVSIHQVSCQTSHPARPTRQYSNVYSYLEWKDARCECAGYLDSRSWGFLHHGPGLSGFRKTIPHRSGERVFRHSSKKKMVYRRQYSHAVTTEEKLCGVRCDQTIVLTGVNSKNDYPQQLRRVKYYDSKSNRTFNFLTNNFTIPAQTVADLYRYRWQVELFFKWIKQHLRIKSFFGVSENAVKSQIWIAISVYVLVAIIKSDSVSK